jgi:hypothetical protein
MAFSSQITQTDGTVRATTIVGLMYQLILLGFTLQGRYNRAKPKTKKNLIQIDKRYDGESATLTAQINLEGQRIDKPGELRPDFVFDKTLSEYILDDNNALVAFDGGTGALEGIESWEQAVFEVAERLSFLESQIEPDLLLKEVNIVNTTPNPEDGAVALNISIPMKINFDSTTGGGVELPKNYLYILDVADNEAI